MFPMLESLHVCEVQTPESVLGPRNQSHRHLGDGHQVCDVGPEV